MQTLNGILTETYQDLVVKGDFEVDGAVDFTNHKELVYEGEVLCWENDVLTYTDSD